MTITNKYFTVIGQHGGYPAQFCVEKISNIGYWAWMRIDTYFGIFIEATSNDKDDAICKMMEKLSKMDFSIMGDE